MQWQALGTRSAASRAVGVCMILYGAQGQACCELAAPAPVRSGLLLYDRRGREHQLVLCTRTALHHAARVLLCETDLSTLRNTLPLNPVRTVTRRRLLDRRSAASTGRGDP